MCRIFPSSYLAGRHSQLYLFIVPMFVLVFESRDWSVFKFKEWVVRQAFWTNPEYAIIDGPNPRGIPEDQLWPKAACAMVVLGYCAVGCLFTAEPQGQNNRGWDHPGQHKRQVQPASTKNPTKYIQFLPICNFFPTLNCHI